MRPALLALVLLGCDAGKEPAAATRPFVDDRGRSVAVPVLPRRIVSIVPSTTELLYAAGAGDQIAGVTHYCVWPPEAKDKPKVGSILLDFEKIASLKPDLILTSWAVAKKSTAELEEKGYPVFSIDPHTFEDIARSIRTLGAMTGHESDAEKAASALEARVRAVKPGRNPTFYFEHSADPMGTAGPESYVGDALRRAGGRNVFEGGWKLIDWESVLARDPEVILISHDSCEGLSRRAGWANLKAVKNGRVHFVKLESFLYPTPRLVDGLEEAARIFNDKSP